MKRLRLTLALAMALSLSVLLAACGGGGGSSDSGGGEEGGGSGDSGGSGETITVASDIAYRPFEYNEGGEPVGFDIDLMREVGERAGFEPEFQNVVFDGIIEGLGTGLYDAGISAMTITPEREEQIAFSDPYFNADQSLLVPSDSDIGSTEDLGDTTIGAQRGTTGESEAQRISEEVGAEEVVTFNNVEDAFTALENGQVDSVVNDLPVSQARVEQTGDALEIVETISTGEQYGIAFPQDSDLVEPANEALQEIKDDGTYAELYERWIGVEPETIP